MKVVKVMFVLLVLVLSMSSAFSQDEIMMLENTELRAHKRPPVQFTHEKHANIIDCQRCHHDYDQYGNNRGGDGDTCASCHSVDGGERVPIIQAFHIQCKGCHEDLLARGKPTGPIMCGECHVRK